jgi:hypothetical protein
MGLREDLLKRIERKRAEIVELESQTRLAREYLQALEDTFKLIPRDAATGAEPTVVTLRPGTSLARSRDAIRKAGRPLHLTELLTALGKGTSRNERAGLSGTLAAYVRRGEIFTRPAPNTFGLVELKTNENDDAAPVPPAGFGKL